MDTDTQTSLGLLLYILFPLIVGGGYTVAGLLSKDENASQSNFVMAFVWTLGTLLVTVLLLVSR